MTDKKLKQELAEELSKFYEQQLEPKFPTEYSDGKHTYRKNYLAYAEKLLTYEDKESYYATYEVLKECSPPNHSDEDGNEIVYHPGQRIYEQVLMPHQQRPIMGFAYAVGGNCEWLLEALSKRYVRFIGVWSRRQLEEAEGDEEDEQ